VSYFVAFFSVTTERGRHEHQPLGVATRASRADNAGEPTSPVGLSVPPTSYLCLVDRSAAVGALPFAERGRLTSAVETRKLFASDEARRLLERYSREYPNARVAQAARAALSTLSTPPKGRTR